MDNGSQSAYFQTQVLSATPQKLRLMLIEGALRFAAQAKEHWKGNRNEPASLAVGRCRAILAELLATVDRDASGVVDQVRQLYAYLLRTLIDANQTRDVDKLAEIVELLQIERETWRQVCQQMPNPPPGHRFGAGPEVTGAGDAAIWPRQASGGLASDPPPGPDGISFQA